MAELDVWKYRAYIIPALGKPIAHGECASVLSVVLRLLRDHPRYRIALRSVTYGKVESRHAIHLRTSVDNKILVTLRPPDGIRGDEQQAASDYAEVLAVLTNLGTPIHDPGAF